MEGMIVGEAQPSRHAQSEQYEALRQAMRSYLPHALAWTPLEWEPSLEVTLPRGFDACELLGWSENEGVAFTLGQDDVVHLNFSHLEPAKIQQGIRRLGKVFVDYIHLAWTYSGATNYFLGP